MEMSVSTETRTLHGWKEIFEAAVAALNEGTTTTLVRSHSPIARRRRGEKETVATAATALAVLWKTRCAERG